MAKKTPEMEKQQARSAAHEQRSAERQYEHNQRGGREFILSLPPGSLVVNFNAGPAGRARTVHLPDGSSRFEVQG